MADWTLDMEFRYGTEGFGGARGRSAENFLSSTANLPISVIDYYVIFYSPFRATIAHPGVYEEDPYLTAMSTS